MPTNHRGPATDNTEQNKRQKPTNGVAPPAHPPTSTSNGSLQVPHSNSSNGLTRLVPRSQSPTVMELADGTRCGTPVPLIATQDGYTSDASIASRTSTHKSAPSHEGRRARLVQPDSFEPETHFYPRVLNANLHPMVNSFMKLSNETIAQRYTHLHPKVNKQCLANLLNTPPTSFQWAGCDLFNVTNYSGQRQMIVIETNSCPSGQKSFPQHSHETQNTDGYHTLMTRCFKQNHDRLKAAGKLPEGELAVVYDKNPMETGGYAEAMATVMNEPVWLVEYYEDDADPPVKFEDCVMYIRDVEEEWHAIRATFRYVTQSPWCRLPVSSKTYILNPVAACLAGGRNKMAADKAYELLNKELLNPHGLSIRTPETIRDVTKAEIPMWVKSMGGHAVVKNPYSNAGQGVYTITSDSELTAFMAEDHRYDKFIVQSLVGNASWSSVTRSGSAYFHTGTVPNRKGQTFVNDLRMMVVGTSTGYEPIALYARRAMKPLVEHLTPEDDSWAMLGTNLSIKKVDGEWSSETERLLMMDLKDFNKLGLGIDDLIDGYVQTVMAATAIDRLAQRLIMEDGKFDFELYKSLNADNSLLAEIYNP